MKLKNTEDELSETKVKLENSQNELADFINTFDN